MPTSRSPRKTKRGATKRAGATKRSAAPKKSKPRSAAAEIAANDNQWFELRRSSIQGLGGFARRDIPKGTRIIEYVGEKISNAESDRRYDNDTMTRHHTFLFTLNSRTIVDAAVDGNAARFINHSCEPNCEAIIERGHIYIYAKRPIAAGEELLYDYQYEWDSEYTKEDLLFYQCRCGSASCRGTIVKAPKAKLRAWGFIK
jgi:SET domain-containing protein